MTIATFGNCDPPLNPKILVAIEELGFKQMTPVQAATIPLFLRNKDVCVDAVTGSGKTIAFLVPIIEILLKRGTPFKKNQIGALIISPTRELALQIHAVVLHFQKHIPEIRTACIIGGTAVEKNMQQLQYKGGSILVATPGRLDCLLTNYNVLDMKEMEVLVLDEADTILDMGFRETISSILSQLPRQRRTGLFSATQTKETKDLARAGLRNPVTVCVTVRDSNTKGTDSNAIRATPSSLKNYYITCFPEQKLGTLIRFLNKNPSSKIIIFTLTCIGVNFLADMLSELSKMENLVASCNDVDSGDSCDSLNKKTEAVKLAYSDKIILKLHGKLVQKERNATFQNFFQLKSGILVCTDVAARGIDFPNVDWIVQYEPPKDPSYFIHRVGRTARAGKRGSSLSFLLPKEEAYIEFLSLKNVTLKPFDIETNTESSIAVDDNSSTDGLKGSFEESCAESSIDKKYDGFNRNIMALAKSIVRSNRELLESGTSAFISYIRAYKEHHCQFIFRLADLDFGAIATSFALLKLPKMPELKTVNLDSFKAEDIDTSTICYKDARREKRRKENLITQKEENEKRRKEVSDTKYKRKKEKENQKLEKERIKADRDRRKLKKNKYEHFYEELDQALREQSLYKRMKRGKLTKKEFEEAIREPHPERKPKRKLKAQTETAEKKKIVRRRWNKKPRRAV